MNINYQSLEIEKNYLYDGNKSNGEILKIEDLKYTLIKYNLYVGIYVKS